MFKVLLLEDEIHNRNFLKKILLEHPLVLEVFDTAIGADAITLARAHDLDVAFFDVELQAGEGLNGIDIAEIIYNLNPGIKFIFVTGYPSYAIDAFLVHPYDYILKPFKKEKITQVVNSLAKESGSKSLASSKIIIKSETDTYFIPSEEVIFAEKLQRNIIVHTKKRTYEVSQNLSELELTLNNNFLKVHRSYIVNLDKVSKLTHLGNRAYELEFEDYEQKALISRNKFDELKSRFKL